MPDYAPDQIPGRLPRRMAAALVRLGAIGAVMLCAAGTFAYAGGWLPGSRLTGSRLAGGHLALGRMTAVFRDASAGHADFRGAQGACGAGLFESAGQATALSSPDVPVTARGMVSHFPPPARGQRLTGIDDIAVLYQRPAALTRT